MRDVASAGGMPACMSCVMTKKTLTDFLFLEVLSHNVGQWNHVLFMGLSLVWNIGRVDVRLCSTFYIIKRVNFHSKKLIALHMVSDFFWGEIMEFTRFQVKSRGKDFFPILGYTIIM